MKCTRGEKARSTEGEKKMYTSKTRRLRRCVCVCVGGGKEVTLIKTLEADSGGEWRGEAGKAGRVLIENTAATAAVSADPFGGPPVSLRELV